MGSWGFDTGGVFALWRAQGLPIQGQNYVCFCLNLFTVRQHCKAIQNYTALVIHQSVSSKTMCGLEFTALSRLGGLLLLIQELS
jgi:hypothetical protein